MNILVSDRENIANEFAYLCDHYAGDYPELRQMYQIACDLCSCHNPQALMKAYGVFKTRVLLIARYDLEFKAASLRLYEELSTYEDIAWAEPKV